MRRLWIVIAAIIVLVPITLTIVLSLIPDSVYREQAQNLVKSATGRELTIGGDVSVSLFPTLGFSASDVAVANAAGFQGDTFATAKSLEAGVALLPLITGKIRIAKVALIEPVIALQVDAAGNNNWTVSPEAGAPEPEGPAVEKKGGQVSEISIESLKLVDGRVSYQDRRSGETWDARDINVTTAITSLDDPLSAQGSAVWKDRKVALNVNVENPRAITTEKGGPLVLKVDSDLLKVEFLGSAAMGGVRTLQGQADIDVSSVRELSAWLATPMEPGKGFGPLKIKGRLDVKGDTYRFEDATVQFDKINGSGRVTATTGAVRPYVTAALAVDTLDTGPYLNESSHAGAGGATGGDRGPGAGPSEGAAGAAGGAWSTEKIDLSGLKAVDGDFTFQAKKVLFQKMTFSDSALDIKLNNGVLTADLSKLSLYGGAGKARLVLNGAGAVPELATDFAIASIQIEPFLRDAAGFTRLSGTGNLTLSVKSRGQSQKAMAESLSGSGAMKVVDGALKGINLAAMVRNLTGAFAGGGGEQKTDFASLGGTYTITNGVLQNTDLELLNPLLRLAGSGTANIGNRTLDYLVVPKAVATIEGQGGRTDLTGLSVPVRITGTWDSPKYAPDHKSLLQGAVKGLTEAQGAGQDPLKGALKGIIGQPGARTEPAQGTPPEGEAAPAKKEDPAEKLLKGVLGQ